MTKKITIVLEGGLVEEIKGLPEGWDYDVQDFDACSECGQYEPYCEDCEKEFNRCEHGYPGGRGCPECAYWERGDYERDRRMDR